MKTLLMLFALTAAANAQSLPLPTTGESLTPSEELALRYVTQEFNQAQKDFANLNEAVRKNHPGYYLSPSTGTLIAIEQPKAPEPAKAPEVKTDKK